jgi:hypothetical protein
MFPFVCVIYAITGFKTDVQQLAQMLGAAVVPGNSQANMCTFRFDVSLQQCSSCIVTGIPLHPAILYTRSGSIQTWHGTDRRALSSATDFTLYGYNSCAQGLSLARDLKMGQYCKLPPIANVIVQIIGTIIGALLQLIIMKQVISNQREILLDTQGSNVWSGQQVQSFNSQAVSWGALAKYFYGPGSTYQIIPYWCVFSVEFSLAPLRFSPGWPI